MDVSRSRTHGEVLDNDREKDGEDDDGTEEHVDDQEDRGELIRVERVVLVEADDRDERLEDVDPALERNNLEEDE